MLNKNGDAEDSFLESVDLDPKIEPHIYTPFEAVQDTFKTSIDDKIELIKEKHRRLADHKGSYKAGVIGYIQLAGWLLIACSNSPFYHLS